MKKTLALIAALSLASSAFAADKTINPADAKRILKTKVDAKIVERLRDIKLPAPDKECEKDFAIAVAKAEALERRCNNVDNPPAGSPIAVFNALNNIQLAQRCGDKTLDACVAEVVAQQATFCDAQSKPAIDEAKALRDKCVKFVKACDEAKKALAANTAEIAKLEKQLADAKAASADLKRRSDTICRIADRLKD